MTRATATEPISDSTRQTSALPANFLNGYEILNMSLLAWPVSTYIVERADGQKQSHKDRSQIKNAIWTLKMEHKNLCRGYGFVIDVDEQTVAVPQSWKLPSPAEVGEYVVRLGERFTARADELKGRAIIKGIIREAIKKYFKENKCEELGELWQDYGSFCQMPNDLMGSDYYMCRRFDVAVEVLRQNTWVLQCSVNTTTLDGRTLADYYRRGEANILAGMIEDKRANRLTRQNRPTAVRVWRNKSNIYKLDVSVLELDDPDLIIKYGTLSADEQKAFSGKTVLCRPFKGQPIDVPLSEIRLILDSQITQEEHADTIINPAEREQFIHHLRNFIDGVDVYGEILRLSPTPFDIDRLPTTFILPPAIRVKDKNGDETIIEPPIAASDDLLKKRMRDRSDHIRRYGFLRQRPINPLLAWHRRFGKQTANRMKNDLNYLLESQGIEYKFEFMLFNDVDEIRKEIERNGYDALLAVLPERSRSPHDPNNTHEKIKRSIEAPSQCIHYDNTLPREWVARKHRELQDAKPKLARRIRQMYELCLANLLVKHHWVPFAPVEAFYYNVQVGVDVGGRHNTQAMTCLGYGFQKPLDGLIFRPDEIPLDVQKAEPIPVNCLYEGLLRQFEYMHSELESLGIQADFERSLFYRDGELSGDGDIWNEREAFELLYAELRNRGWVTENAIWTVVEVPKFAGGWRVLRNLEGVTNPLAGQCIFPFDDENRALICTTGAPYLPQGTARPIMIKINDIHGRANRHEVIRDLVWQADMCFTKPDTGMRLPWVLHVADTGALQLSKSYKITGITA